MKGPGYERYLTVDLLYFQFSKGQMTHGRLGRVIVVVAFLDPGPALHDCLTYKSGILGIALDKGGNIAAIPIRIIGWSSTRNMSALRVLLNIGCIENQTAAPPLQL